MDNELKVKTEIEQFHELANITRKLDIPITMSVNSIVSLSDEIDILQEQIKTLKSGHLVFSDGYENKWIKQEDYNAL